MVVRGKKAREGNITRLVNLGKGEKETGEGKKTASIISKQENEHKAK